MVTDAGRLNILAACWSAAAVVIGSWWWIRPAAYPFARPGDNGFPTLVDLVPASVGAPVLVVAGVVGLLALVVRVRALLVAVGAAQAVVFGMLAAGVAPVAMAGYVMAMLGPIVLAGTLLAGAWRRGGLLTIAIMAGIVAVAWFTGFADGPVLRRYLDVMAGGAAQLGPPAALAFLLLGGVAWGVLTARLVLAGRARPVWAEPTAAARWGRVAALVAAACALPYFLLRLTWLTPWPLGLPGSALTLEPEIRLHGTLLGLAALAGAVLTLGLFARWGEVWPRWMPVVHGRPVPVAAAVVPGAFVATLFTAAAVPMAIDAFRSGRLEMLVVFPFWLWGPALGVAVLGYAWRRRGSDDRLAQSSRS